MRGRLDIEVVLDALALGGVEIDLPQRLALDRLFDGIDGIGPAEAAAAVGALLARDVDEQRRITAAATHALERVAAERGELQPAARRESGQASAVARPPAADGEPRRWLTRRRIALGLLAGLVVAGIAAYGRWHPPEPEQGARIVRPRGGTMPRAAGPAGQVPPPEVKFSVEVPYAGPLTWDDAWLRLLVTALALLALASASHPIARLRRWWRGRAEPRVAALDPVLHLKPPPGAPALFDDRQRETIVWSVGRVPIRSGRAGLDPEATVRATARAGGLPAPVWRPVTRLRTIWLLCDLDARDPFVRRLADAIDRICAEAGLPVRHLDVDRRMTEVFESGLRVETGALEEGAWTATALILTDGAALVGRIERAVTATVRAWEAIADWPHRVVVDVSAGRFGLGRALAPLGLPVIHPLDVPGWFQSGLLETRQPGRHAIETWATLYRLAGQPVDDAEALALRADLLDAWPDAPSPLTLPLMREVLVEPAAGRADIARLAQARPELHQRAARYWRARFSAEVEKRGAEARDDDRDWSRSIAADRWRATEALLAFDLAESPAERARAGRQLYAVAAPTQRAFAEQALGHRLDIEPDPAERKGSTDSPSSLDRIWSHRARLAEKMPRALLMGIAVGALTSLSDAASYAIRYADTQHIVTMIQIPGGMGWVGSDPDDPDHMLGDPPLESEPVASYTLTGSEVTLRQYRSWGGAAPPACNAAVESSHPVACITWFEARAFCRALGPGFDLPTGAQWAFAARAGTPNQFGMVRGRRALDDSAWFADNSDGHSHQVSKRKPNWALWDLYGNLAEWTLDAMPADDSPDPMRAVRGGSYADGWRALRASAVAYLAPDARSPRVGFRCAGPPRPEVYKSTGRLRYPPPRRRRRPAPR